MHSWNKVTSEKLKHFIKILFSINIEIIWHNLKYDLEIIDLFLKTENNTNLIKEIQLNRWQLTLEL